MNIDIEFTDDAGNIEQRNVTAEVIYDALARMLGLIEVRTNQWVNEYGEYYALTKYGFQRHGVNSPSD